MENDLDRIKDQIREEMRKETQQTISDNVGVAAFMFSGMTASYMNGYGFMMGAIAGLVAFCVVYRKY
jgi:hypothetical protein